VVAFADLSDDASWRGLLKFSLETGIGPAKKAHLCE
jgi:hypothetical protein